VTRRKHNCDIQRTAEAKFQDKRSYWTHAGHEFLFGDDVRQRRAEIFERDKGLCQLKVSKDCIRYPGWYGHLHHIKGGNTDDRCWDKENLLWVCRHCHVEIHPRVKWRHEDQE
jgi:hypothetical protein